MSNYQHVICNAADALSEFSLGNTDDCGPCALAVAFGAHYSIRPVPSKMGEARDREMGKNWFVSHGGINVNNLWRDAKEELNLPATLVPIGTNQGEIMQRMHDAVFNKCPVILNLHAGGSLIHSEPGVVNHFITIVGGDSMLGYLIANGDYWDGKNVISSPYVPLYWATRQQILNAWPMGAITFDTYKP